MGRDGEQLLVDVDRVQICPPRAQSAPAYFYQITNTASHPPFSPNPSPIRQSLCHFSRAIQHSCLFREVHAPRTLRIRVWTGGASGAPENGNLSAGVQSRVFRPRLGLLSTRAAFSAPLLHLLADASCMVGATHVGLEVSQDKASSTHEAPPGHRRSTGEYHYNCHISGTLVTALLQPTISDARRNHNISMCCLLPAISYSNRFSVYPPFSFLLSNTIPC